MEDSYSVSPIGIYRCRERYRYETPRQSVFASNEGLIELKSGCRYESAAADLEGFDRIWILFIFHLNEKWNPLVRPPVAPDRRKIGVFATRSPHRPNRIGMSCVELLGVDGRFIRVKNCDLLDLTPVIDIKPYIPKADAFPEAAAGWVDRTEEHLYRIEFTPQMLQEARLLADAGGPDLEHFCRVQLVQDPLNGKRKRLYPAENGVVEIGFRTWRIRFSVEPEAGVVRVLGIRSHYKKEELAPESPDVYGDKALHRAWLASMASVQQTF